jgi:hypothetical protein
LLVLKPYRSFQKHKAANTAHVRPRLQAHHEKLLEAEPEQAVRELFFSLLSLMTLDRAQSPYVSVNVWITCRMKMEEIGAMLEQYHADLAKYAEGEWAEDDYEDGEVRNPSRTLTLRSYALTIYIPHVRR